MVWKDLYDKGMFNLMKRICLFGELLKSIPGIRKSQKKKKKRNVGRKYFKELSRNCQKGKLLEQGLHGEYGMR